MTCTISLLAEKPRNVLGEIGMRCTNLLTDFLTMNC